MHECFIRNEPSYDIECSQIENRSMIFFDYIIIGILSKHTIVAPFVPAAASAEAVVDNAA